MVIIQSGKTIQELTLDNNTYIIENPNGEITGTIVNSMFQNIINSLPFSGSTNLDIDSATNGDYLKYDGNKWVNSGLTVVATLSELTDVNINNSLNNQYLKYDGNKWVNSNMAIIDTSTFVNTGETQTISGAKTFEKDILVKNLTNTNGNSQIIISQGLSGVDPDNYGVDIRGVVENADANHYGMDFYTMLGSALGKVKRLSITAIGDVISQRSLITSKDGNDTPGEGPFFMTANAAIDRMWLSQLGVGNDLRQFYYGGAAWELKNIQMSSGSLNLLSAYSNTPDAGVGLTLHNGQLISGTKAWNTSPNTTNDLTFNYYDGSWSNKASLKENGDLNVIGLVTSSNIIKGRIILSSNTFTQIFEESGPLSGTIYYSISDLIHMVDPGQWDVYDFPPMSAESGSISFHRIWRTHYTVLGFGVKSYVEDNYSTNAYFDDGSFVRYNTEPINLTFEYDVNPYVSYDISCKQTCGYPALMEYMIVIHHLNY